MSGYNTTKELLTNYLVNLDIDNLTPEYLPY